jgi:glucokinase
MSYIIGLDFGGTKLAAGLVNSSSGLVAAAARQPTPPGGAAASLAAMLDLARSLLDAQSATADHRPLTTDHPFDYAQGRRPPTAEDRGSKSEDRGSPDGSASSSILDPRSSNQSSVVGRRSSVVGVGVSFNGPVAADGRTVRRSMHIPGWDDFALAERLERELGAPTLIANDADAAALAEQRFGAGRGARHLLYLTISTGIGGGVIVDGRLHRGERAWAGEVGHMPLVPDGPPCACGRQGCLEALASGLSIARAARQRLRSATHSSRLQSLPADQITARDVAAAAAQGDELARAVWEEAMGWLGLGVAAAVNLLDPGRVVLGGGLTHAGALLFDPVRRVVAARALDPDVEVVPAALGDDVGILGGAALMIDV